MAPLRVDILPKRAYLGIMPIYGWALRFPFGICVDEAPVKVLFGRPFRLGQARHGKYFPQLILTFLGR